MKDSLSSQPSWQRRIPYVVYIVGNSDAGSRSLQEVIQEPFPAVDEDGVAWVLQDLLLWLMPDDFQETARNKGCDRVTVQGIHPPLDTPLSWLSQHLSQPDNFLHIIIDA